MLDEIDIAFGDQKKILREATNTKNIDSVAMEGDRMTVADQAVDSPLVEAATQHSMDTITSALMYNNTDTEFSLDYRYFVDVRMKV